MRIVSIDGNSSDVRLASLAPGLHSVDVRFRTGNYNGSATVPCDLKPGGVYEYMKLLLRSTQEGRLKSHWKELRMGQGQRFIVVS